MKFIPFLTVSLALSLAACGGGSSSTSNSSSSVSSLSSSAESSVSSVESSVASSVSSAASSESSIDSSASVSSEASSLTSSESSSSEASSSSTSNLAWNSYNGNFHPATSGSITLADSTTSEFTQSGTGDYFTALIDGTVTLDTSSATANTSGANFLNIVNADATYPKTLTLIAGISGNTDSLRMLELEVAMADSGVAGSRVKTILRNDGSNKGVQLESANNGTSANSFGISDMDKFAIYQIAITLTDATTGSVNVYRNGSLMPNLSLSNVTMRATSAVGDNFIRFGEVSGSAAYKSSIDWMLWTNTGAYNPAEVAGTLPTGLGCVYGYGSSDATDTCVNLSGSSSSGASSSSASSVDYGSAEVRPAKIEGFAAYANVTGGAGGEVIYVSTGTELNAALCSGRASKTTPIIIMVDGTINHSNTTAQGCNTVADQIEIKQMSNVSIIGVGTNALFDELGIHVRDSSNIIIQNVHIRNVKKSGTPISNGGDAIGMESGVDKVWIDHNWLEASGGEKDGYDSLLDMKSGVTNVTVSYNLYNDSSRAGLVGYNDDDAANTNITFHHNWYRNIQQRTPLVRQALVHVYNNFWDNDDLNYMIHGINSRANGKVLVESNYFHNANNPLLASDDSPTPGCWQTNNDNTLAPYYYSRSVGNGALVVPEMIDGQMQSTCVVTVPYTVDMDAAANVPAVVMANAGVGKIATAANSSSSSSSASSEASSSSSVSSGEASSSSSDSSLGNTSVLTANFATLGDTGLTDNSETTLSGEVDAPSLTNTNSYAFKLTGKLRINTAQTAPGGSDGSTGAVQFGNNTNSIGKVLIKQVQCPFRLQVNHAPSASNDATRKLRIMVDGAEAYYDGNGSFMTADITPSCSGNVDVEIYGYNGTNGAGVRIFDINLIQ